jgi:hypothetical protein
MSQITIYLPDEVETKARVAAKAKGESVSRWVAEQVSRNLEDAWSQGVLDAAGTLTDFPTLEEVRTGYGRDTPREPLK